ncbi:hypothetical protein [Mycetocola saprophilus]|uniref:hypothetical protein n=1 Tax=Mycetocola saprophilus TaxID=76636 RepID=UPI0004C09DA4|nr:hypothetical protein [Mycetocola saprophilus]
MTDRLTVLFKSGNKFEFEAESWRITLSDLGEVESFAVTASNPEIAFIDIEGVDIITAAPVKRIGG